MIKETFSGVDTSVLLALTHLEIPYLYDAGKISNRAVLLNRLMTENGYPFANVTINIDNQDNDKSRLTVKYIAFTDQVCNFSDPYFHGPFVTKKKILCNDFLPVKGERFNQNKVVESEKRLKNRNYIKEIIISPPEIESTDPTGPELVTVPVYIVDRSGLGLDGTAGFAASNGVKPSFYGSLKLSLVNLLHTGESALFDYSGDKISQKLRLEISKPWLFNLPLVFDAAMELEVVQEQYGFLSGQINFFSEIGAMWRIGVGANVSEVTPKADSVTESGTFVGADLILARIAEPLRRGESSMEFIIKSGSGISKKSINYSRSHIEFLTGAHIPLFGWQAVKARLISKHLITNEKDLIPAELYRVGGHNSLRGYSDNEFPFKTVLFGQLEYLLYFSETGAAFIFSDGGVGFDTKVDLNGSQRYMMGYGLGIRLPSKIGSVTLELARSIDDRKSLGRVHIRFQNELANNSGKILSKF